MKSSFADGMAITVAKNLIEAIFAFGVGVDEWERARLTDYGAILAGNKPLTQEQSKTLREIHRRRIKSRSPDAARPDTDA